MPDQATRPKLPAKVSPEAEQFGGMGELSDKDYIRHAMAEEWSVCQAIYLTHDRNPPDNDQPFQKLKSLFPEPANTRGMWWILEHSREDRQPKRPEEWLTHFWGYGAPPIDTWRAIFPYCETESMNSMRNLELDYRQFVHHFVRDLELPLERLIYFAIKPRPDRTSPQQQKQFDRILHHIEPMLRADGEYIVEENSVNHWRVKPEKFLALFPPSESLAEKCAKWRDWPKRHPKLAKWLRSPSGRTFNMRGAEVKEKANFGRPSPAWHDPVRAVFNRYFEERGKAPKFREIPSLLQAQVDDGFETCIQEVDFENEIIHYAQGPRERKITFKTVENFLPQLRLEIGA